MVNCYNMCFCSTVCISYRHALHVHICLTTGVRVGSVKSVPDPFSSYIVGPCTETMALNGYINICILWQEFSNWSPIYSLG